jgi:murein DD-endopeptidase MepM/ murein hydrolase activator NlpD
MDMDDASSGASSLGEMQSSQKSKEGADYRPTDVAVNDYGNSQSPESDESSPEPDEKIVKVKSGETFVYILDKLGFKRSESNSAAAAITKIFNLRNLKIGQEISIKSGTSGDGLSLEKLSIRTPEFVVIAERQNDGSFRAKKSEIQLKKVIRTVSGVMDTKNPVKSLQSAGLKKAVALDAVAALRMAAKLGKTKSPVTFELLFHDFYDSNGNPFGSPQVKCILAIVDGKIVVLYVVKCNGRYVCVNGDGKILRPEANITLLKPLRIMHVTSKYGYRPDPIRGFSAMHTGIDLKAKQGTPVLSPAKGVVEFVGRRSGYGLYIRIRHSKDVCTAFAHLRKIYAVVGQTVKEGDVIGEVGVTGRVTGPHLHFEVIERGNFVNPATFSSCSLGIGNNELSPDARSALSEVKKELKMQIVSLIKAKSIH